MTSLIARCLGLEYQPGSFELCQGVKGSWSGKYEGGQWFESRGFGWGQRIEPSKLILSVQVEGVAAVQELWVDRFFKDRLGRLTEKRRNALKATMPITVMVTPHTGRKGRAYYKADEACLAAWLANAKAALGMQ
jgi:hypothetical protein